LVPPALDESRLGFATDADVARLIEDAPPGEFVDFEGWKVMWTGWKASQMSVDLTHQWVAGPIDPPQDGPFHGMFGAVALCVPMPGRVTLLRRGESFDHAFHWQQVGYAIDCLGKDYPAALALGRGAGVTARLLLEAMRGACEFKPVAECPSADDIAWNWDKLSATSAFYLDPGRYAKETGDDSGEAQHKLFERLYGLE
jgi:hypothetical protein